MSGAVSESGRAVRVVVVAPVPPPIHGAAATTQGILDYLRPHVDLRVANVSPGRATGIASHLTRVWRTLKAMGLLITNCRESGRVLYMTADGGLGMAYNVAVSGLGTLLGYRVFLHHHSFSYVDRRSRLMSMISGILARRGTHVVLCQAMADGLRAHYPVGAAFELSSAALLPTSPRSAAGSGAALRMGFLSNLIIEKGLDTSIALLRAARAEGLPVELLIAGKPVNPADSRPLDLIAEAKADMGESIVYLGPLSEPEKDAFLDDLDVFLFPSRYVNEAQPRAVLEALARGVPVLTIARSCITTDMGEGTGVCVPRDGDFVATALPYVRQWASSRPALDQVSEAAGERGKVLYALGQAQLHLLAEAFKAAQT